MKDPSQNPFQTNGVSLERLRALEEVVKEGTITAASKTNPTRQSQISHQIADLEDALGVKLLDRSAKPHRPTPVAVRLAKSYERFVREVRDVSAEAKNGRKPITVGAGELVIREVLIPWIGKKRKQATGVSWVISSLTSRQIQQELALGRLDIGLAAGLEASGTVRVKEIASYGMKLVLPENQAPDQSGWQRLAKTPLVVLQGDGSFRRFLATCEDETGIRLEIAAECSSYPQAVDLAEAAGWAVFVPELWWRRRREDWAKRTQPLPGLEEYRHTLLLGWNEKIAKRRPEIQRLVEELGITASPKAR